MSDEQQPDYHWNAPYRWRKRRQWLNPLRFLCALGFHRMDGVIAERLLHCGRCRSPFRI